MNMIANPESGVSMEGNVAAILGLALGEPDILQTPLAVRRDRRLIAPLVATGIMAGATIIAITVQQTGSRISPELAGRDMPALEAGTPPLPNAAPRRGMVMPAAAARTDSRDEGRTPAVEAASETRSLDASVRSKPPRSTASAGASNEDKAVVVATIEAPRIALPPAIIGAIPQAQLAPMQPEHPARLSEGSSQPPVVAPINPQPKIDAAPLGERQPAEEAKAVNRAAAIDAIKLLRRQ